jgi:hypothetical protein
MSDEKVGYKRPPKATQFKKGQSGNPKGRPKGRKSTGTIISEAFNTKRRVRELDRERSMTQIEISLHACLQKAMRGDVRALTALLREARLAGTSGDIAEPGGHRGVLIVPAEIDPESWAKAAEEHQRKFAANIGEPASIAPQKKGAPYKN